MPNSVIIGAGEIGTALARVLAKRRHPACALWDKQRGKVPGQRPLAELVPPAKVAFLGVPSTAVRPHTLEVCL